MIRSFFLTLKDLFYPRHCLGCQRALLQQEFLCLDCESQVETLPSLCCRICSYPFLNNETKTCSNCAGRKLHFVTAISPFRYQGLTREFLARYKYGRDESLKPLLQQLIVKGLEDGRLLGIDFVAVVPVPLHPLRERERGFNQVLPLARTVAHFGNWPLCSLLKRSSFRSFQAGSDRKKRLQNLERTFVLDSRQILHGNYLLVDDVLTTGATLDECAKVLLQAGANGVWAMTLAR